MLTLPVQKLLKRSWKSSYSVALALTILYPLTCMMMSQATLGLLGGIRLLLHV